MAVKVRFECGGCDAKAEGIRHISRPGHRLFGNWATKGPWNVDKAVPEGWVASDPYTGCCYCPKCWAEIEEGETDAD